MIILVSPAAGGVAHVAGAIADQLRADGGRVHQIVVTDHRNDQAPAEADDRTVVACRRAPALSACRAAWAARRVLRAAEILHLELGRSAVGAFWFGLAAVMLRGRRRTVLIAHDMPVLIKSPGAGLLAVAPGLRDIIAYRLIAPMLDRVLVAALRLWISQTLVFSRSAAEAATARRWPSVAVLVHGAAPPSAAAPPPSLGTHVLMAGFLAPDKGVDVLLDAWDRIDAPLPLIIVGAAHRQSGAWAQQLKARCEQRPDATRWLGPVDDSTFADLIAAAAVVVLPYRASNPASGILVRALVEGRAVIATRVPAAVTEIRDGDTGRLIAIDDTTALAANLQDLLRHPDLRDRLGAAAQAEAVERHSWRVHADQLRSAYHGQPATLNESGASS
ncbi:glycosyltransferase family 4 protein [Dactylosporangium siamense]|uniref:Glycosyltransferase n=1 Tax=Dactylosporangium siamense TaxID=685454 RepID=A0A919PV37_9ACTN|nr:glycosyltransferase family 4 protein [Dactylosporangium siamense]GIG50267.1 hypothetical protein Dsi01nite_083080 [Dactylosporangium siamense]